MKQVTFIAGATISAEGQIFINGELLPSIGKKKEGYKVQVTLSADVANNMLEGQEGDVLEFTQEELVALYEFLPNEDKSAERKTRIKELKKAIEKLVLAGKYDELAVLGEELRALEASKPTKEAKVKEVTEATPEQKVQIEFYEAKIAEIDAIKEQIAKGKEALNQLIETLPSLREGIESFTKRYGSKATGEGNTAPKNIVGQDVRQMYAELIGTMKHSEAVNKCAEHFGCGTNTINRCVLYIQHPLNEGEEIYTPLVNKQFPKYWKCSKGVIHNGAPMAGVIITTAERYGKIAETDESGNPIA